MDLDCVTLFLHRWQELLAGLLAFVAGAFIFVEGRQQRKRADRLGERRKLAEFEKSKSVALTLSNIISEVKHDVEEYEVLIKDACSRSDAGKTDYTYPEPVEGPKTLDLLFVEMAKGDFPVQLAANLSHLLDRLAGFEADQKALASIMAKNVFVKRAIQPEFQSLENFQGSAIKHPLCQAALASINGVVVSIETLQADINEFSGVN